VKSGLSFGTEGGDNAEKPLLDQLQITFRPELLPKSTPEIFVSYAWGDDSSEDARKRGEVVERLCERLDKDGWHIIRDKTDMRPGVSVRPTAGIDMKLSDA